MADEGVILVEEELVMELWQKLYNCNQYMFDQLQELIKETDNFTNEVKGDFQKEFAGKARQWEGLIYSCQTDLSILCSQFLTGATNIIDRDKLLADVNGAGD